MDTESLFAIAERCRSPAALATLIEAQGHSYRKAGAAMLLTSRGKTVGSLSPGCLEADLALKAEEAVTANRHAIAAYNLRPEEDAVWGEEIGCGGTLRVLLEPLTDELRSALGEVVRSVREGRGARLVRRLNGDRLAYEVRPSLIPVGSDTSRRDAETPFYESLHYPSERLLIFGAGEEAAATEELARGIGFRTIVADWRPALCGPGRFPSSCTIVGDAAEIVAQLQVGKTDFVMLASHNLRRDKEMYDRIVPLRPAYLGIVGSKARIGRLLEGTAPPSFVKAPIGLPILAEGATEIAVSIAAELIEWRRRLRASYGEGRQSP
ncbi:XdhC family protein [Cohnella rhizosphaerae]|uniref:XdhC family protein n=1 Tax=Cohnella rhizosphaerae TaxID=1457232 RepID=A0A9X4QVN8_9BACL|nr:XdhC family protein [Cohnella rhizosphaerae]MDG0812774.1 XdhC family protein [Cohnella rhizosphaerae]